MKWLLLVVSILAVLAGIVVAVGSATPRAHRATSRLEIHQPREAVWATVRDFGSLPSWWSGMKTVERRPERDGREAWLQTLADGSAIEVVVAEESPPGRMVTEIVAESGAAFGGRWIYQLEATPAGTVVSVTEDGWIANLFFRFVSRIMGYYGSLDSYLEALAARFGEPAEPEHVEPS